MNERETIEAAIAAWNEGGPRAFVALLPPEIEWHAPLEFVQGDVWTDRDSLVVDFEGEAARRVWVFFDRDEAMRQVGIDG